MNDHERAREWLLSEGFDAYSEASLDISLSGLLDKVRTEEREACRTLVYDIIVSHGDARAVYCSDCEQSWPHGGAEEHGHDCILADWRWAAKDKPNE